MSQNIQFYYLKTGNGHLAPAKAIAKNMSEKFGSTIKTELVDGLENANRAAKYIIEDGYRNSINNATWVFESLYALHKIKVISRITAYIVSVFVKPYIEQKILQSRPDKIIILHFFLIKPIHEIVKKHHLETPIITVVTDPFTAHPIWFLNPHSQFIVFSESLKKSAVSKGINPSATTVFPFILDSNYTERFSTETVFEKKAEFGFDIQKKIILVIGGGEGIPKGASIAESIRLLKADAEVVFVCGRNERLKNKVLQIKNKYKLDNLTVFGYIDFVHTLLNISDIVVTKCGASTFMEILMAQKIPVISNYIWEQEKGNMEYVRDNNMGIYEKRVHKLPQLLDQLLMNNQLYDAFVSNIHRQNIRNGTDAVSHYIACAT